MLEHADRDLRKTDDLTQKSAEKEIRHGLRPRALIRPAHPIGGASMLEAEGAVVSQVKARHRVEQHRIPEQQLDQMRDFVVRRTGALAAPVTEADGPSVP